MYLYAIYDHVLKEHGHPMTAPNDAFFCREIEMSAGADHRYRLKPRDFDIMCLGEYDPETGNIEVVRPRLVCKMADLLGGA